MDSNSRGIPPRVRDRAGFLMVCFSYHFSLVLIYISLQPMFRREAVWIQFNQLGTTWSRGRPGPAVKISVGGRLTLFAEN